VSARDPLAALLRLRGLEVTAARREMAARQSALAAAEARMNAARRALGEEAVAAAELPDLYAAWLPAGRAALDSASADARRAQDMAEQARADLAATRGAERAVELLREAQAKATSLRRNRKAQQALDETAAQRAVSRAPTRP
jgi:flagellar biosynthesis chaperone FliJ